MRVLLINTSERTGGAAIAANRLMEALKNNGIKAKLLVRDKQTEETSVVRIDPSWLHTVKFVWERVVIWAANRFSKKNLFAVDIANTGIDITSLPEFQQADIIHLHWINQGMISLKEIGKILDSGKPVVWTMHDMWPFTGICHHARACTKYQTACSHCPFLYGGGGKKDLSHRTFLKKQKLYNRTSSLTFVACSHWLEGLAKKSTLFSGHTVVNIPNPINTNLYQKADSAEARSRLKLPPGVPLILFGSVKTTDKRKGIDYLIEACKKLDESHPELKEQLGVVIVGNHAQAFDSLFPFKVYPMGYVSDEREMVNIYNAVDLYVTPSLEENLPNTIMEAMACGTPCVGFRVGGIPEMIDHLHNGYVAQYQSSDDLANGIYWILKDADYPLLCRQATRKAVSHYAEKIVAKQYIDLYNKVTETHD